MPTNVSWFPANVGGISRGFRGWKTRFSCKKWHKTLKSTKILESSFKRGSFFWKCNARNMKKTKSQHAAWTTLKNALQKFCYLFQSQLQCDYPNGGTWNKIIQSQLFLEKKRFSWFFEFERCFLRSQVSSNGFYIFTFTILQAFPFCKAYIYAQIQSGS